MSNNWTRKENNGPIGSDSTLLNASGDNTNFIFEVTGNMDDKKMEHFTQQ